MDNMLFLPPNNNSVQELKVHSTNVNKSVKYAKNNPVYRK